MGLLMFASVDDGCVDFVSSDDDVCVCFLPLRTKVNVLECSAAHEAC